MQQLGLAAMQAWLAGDAAKAERLARQALDTDPHDANALQVMGVAHLNAARLTQAVRYLRAAHEVAPHDPQILNTLAVALRRTGDLDGAREAYARAGAMGNTQAWVNLGNLERTENKVDAAMAAFTRALALDPALASAHAGLAQLYEARHELKRAREHAQLALRTDPSNELALLALGQVALRERDWDGAERLLAPLAKDMRANPVNRALAIGAIGEARDRAGKPDAAFEAFSESNAILRQRFTEAFNDLSSPYHPANVQRMIRFAERANFEAWRHPLAYADAAPVFLVGFPRSGTTLLDQVLSSHSRVLCLEEKEALAGAVADLLSEEALSEWDSFPEALIQERRRLYWQHVEAMGAVVGDRVFVDKLPLNLVLMPAIIRFFPDAKVILALRDPRDAVLSAYQQRFGMNAAMAQMLQLESAARYYDAAMTLAERCRETLGSRLLEIRYEDVVADLEQAARTLAAFLDLAFEPAMLDFNATARGRDINTPSARQVVEPIYSRSVGRWRAYAAQLSPVLPVLAPWTLRFGYDP